MKYLAKFWLLIGVFLTISWIFARLVETWISNGDAILGGVNIDVLFQYAAIFLGSVALFTLGFRSRYPIVAKISISFLSLLFFWGLAEVLCFGLIRLNIVNAPKPFHSRLLINDEWTAPHRPFWGDFSKSFGRWRYPNDSIIKVPVHGRPIMYRANSFGMRDKPRSLQNSSSLPRVVLLGDSFLEGQVVMESERFSNLLEEKTGIEHLNFGINGTSVINYYLNYKNLGKKFDHDVVMVGILPANDFEDYEASQKRGLMRFPIYRPYWEGSFPNVKLAYSLSDISQSLASVERYDKPALTQKVVDSIFQSLTFKDKVIAELSLNSYLLSCTFYWADKLAQRNPIEISSYSKEHFESRWEAFEYSLQQLATEAQGKEVIFYTIPIIGDLRAYDKDKIDDISPRLENLCHRYGISYLNLLPLLHAQGPKVWDRIYQKGDGHWTPEGEKLVARILLNHPVYQQALQNAVRSIDPQQDAKTEPVFLSKLREKIQLSKPAQPSESPTPQLQAPTANSHQTLER